MQEVFDPVSEQASIEDLYVRLKELQKNLRFYEIQEVRPSLALAVANTMAQEYVKDEQKNLKRELLHAQEEVKRIQSVRQCAPRVPAAHRARRCRSSSASSSR